jgi:hypothetical protein
MQANLGCVPGRSTGPAVPERQMRDQIMGMSEVSAKASETLDLLECKLFGGESTEQSEKDLTPSSVQDGLLRIEKFLHRLRVRLDEITSRI